MAVLGLVLLAGCFGGDGGARDGTDEPPVDGCDTVEGQRAGECPPPSCHDCPLPPDVVTDPPCAFDDTGCIPGNGTVNGTAYGPPRNWTEPSAARIRPGVALDDGSCTANFVFTSLDNRTVYLGTAAHCFSNDLNTETDGCLADIDPLGSTMDVQGGGSAKLVYSSWAMMQATNETDDALCNGNDFALLRLGDDDANATSPALRRWGGPTGIAGGSATGAKVLSYGNSGTRPLDSPLSPREGYVTLAGPLCSTRVLFPNTPIPGDSGSPVILANGLALGDFVEIELTPLPGQGHVCLLKDMLDYAARNGVHVQLATWQVLDNGLP